MLNELLRTKSTDYIARYIETPDETVADSGYLTVDLELMKIADVRKGLTRFYGVVHSSITVPDIRGEELEFQVVATPSDPNQIDLAHLDRVVVGPIRLLNGVPYRGGAVRLGIELFSIAAKDDLAAPYLNLLSSVSEKAGVSFAMTALPFVEILRTGIKVIAGGDTLEIGRWADFDPPRPGRYLVVRAGQAQYEGAEWHVAPDGRDVLANGRSLEQPFFLLNFKLSPTRKDWFQIPEIARSYQKIQDSIRDRDRAKLADQLVNFRLTALTCPDLLPDHALRLADQVEAQLGKALDVVGERAPAFATREVPASVFRSSGAGARIGAVGAHTLEALDPFG
jgi:hypothetical protein